MRVVVAYNDDVDLKPHLGEFERAGEEEVVSTAREVAALTGGSLLPVRDVAAAFDDLRRDSPDLVFNLCEGVAGKSGWEMHFALALEMLGIPFTGSDPTAIGICGDKGLTRELLAAAGLPVPRGSVALTRRFAPPSPASWRGHAHPTRWIVKPVHEDAGIGIEPASVCSTQAEVTARVEHVITTYGQPALVEEFIEGRELNQALYHGRRGMVLLPPGEIVFSEGLRPEERVVGWKAKWAEGSEEDRATVNRTPAVIEDTLRSDLSDLCARAASVLSIGGYCRFDLRQRPTGELCILDVNPNPDIGSGSGFRKALRAAGMAFEEFLDELMIAAQSRRRP
ncbi:MAG TPA: hypothetical protein VNA04_05895 [Thermoanaerobaculia bacterium]|nr:hypothetical protein [Thermoanaerobaculia bacterium]